MSLSVARREANILLSPFFDIFLRQYLMLTPELTMQRRRILSSDPQPRPESSDDRHVSPHTAPRASLFLFNSVSVYVHMSAVTPGSQKRALDPVELEL